MMRMRLAAAALTVFLASVALGTLGTPRLSADQGVVVGTNQASAPDSASSTATFEVASVKPNNSGDGRVMLAMPPTGRITATNVPARLLLQQAYQVQPFQIIGAPNWTTSDRFDIVAKAPDGTAPELYRPMMRNLLADRFKLKAHMETREMPLYALVLARTDGKLGPSLTSAKADCEALARGRRAGGPPPAPPQPGEPMQCGMMVGIGNMNAGGIAMADLARSLAGFVNRTVVDKTGLNGRYDFQLTYTPEGRGLPGLPAGAPPVGVEAPAADPNGASLFTALQEQLGLKLDSQKGPVEVLVIDSIEQPTAD
ncbi:MAG TPA: TIGR03435 family protein [Vicinamibacterales bacterium]